MNKLVQNKTPARLDMAQGISGFLLVLFMWAHMLFVSSILISNDAMYWVARMFEGVPLFGKPYPILVSLVAMVIGVLILIHAVLAMRKLPADYAEHKALLSHMRRLNHPDTWLWYIQVVTGVMLMFLVGIHLYQLMMHPGDIGPYASSDRVYSGRMWPLYLVLLFNVELHGGIGIYRLMVKWGIFLGGDDKKARRNLRRIKWLITLFFLILGLFTLAAYYKLGKAHAPFAGERYQPQQTQVQP